MGLKQRHANASHASEEGNQRKGIKPDHHWDFLEEIEAPMWVDFAQEAQSLGKDIYNDWFQTAHPFHQCSSQQLISMLSRSSEGKITSPNLQCLSPKLPDSVSKSRGKHYNCKKWEEGEDAIAKNNQHSIRNQGGKKSWLVSESDAPCGYSTTSTITSNSHVKFATSSGNQTGSLDSMASCTTESNSSAMVTCSSSSIRPMGNFNDSKITSKSKVSIVAQNNQHQIMSEASRHTFGQTNEFLSAVRISLTKSCVTRHASRVEVKDGGLVKHRKSSLSKSSVGSSYNPRCSVDNTDLNVNEILKSRKDKKAAKPTKKERISSNVCKTTFSSILLEKNSNSSTKWERKPIIAKPECQDSKAKIIYSAEPRKPLQLRNVADPLKKRVNTKSKMHVVPDKFNRVVAGGKENTAPGMNQKQKISTNISHANDRNGLTDRTGKTKGRANVIHRVPFR